ncbi:MAG: DUF882 domain-containing protein [Polyangiaceae bacterium]|nr:DUF882 domain-containing protein [Polyangiaceae bacterium]
MARPLLFAHATVAALAICATSGFAFGDEPSIPHGPRALPPLPPLPSPSSPAPAASSPSSKALPTQKTASHAVKPSRSAGRTVLAERGWHTPTPGKIAPLDASGRPMLVLHALNTSDHVELRALSDQGDFSAEDLDRAAHVLRDSRSGNEHPVDPRLLSLVYRISVHFHAHEIRIISGYRTPHGSHVSNHNLGRAVDFVVPGTTDEQVAKYAREQGFVGVGVYPTSGFVHLDVRVRSFFWVDSSGPGKRNRTHAVLGKLAQKSDSEALARGDHPMLPFALGTNIDAALSTPLPAHASDGKHDEDDDEFGLGEMARHSE